MSILVSEVLGNSQKLDGGAMFGNAPRVIWSKWVAPDNLGRISLACRAMLLEIDEKKILCETGIGAFLEPQMAERFGVQESQTHVLLKNLSLMGVTHDEIDYVILSHLHFDHAGGLLPVFGQGKSDELLFPNATYVVGKEAFERSREPHFRDRASFIPGLNKKLENSGRLHVLDKNEQLEDLAQISFFISSGHTPGQLHTVVRGESGKIIFAGDLIPGIHWLHLPITMGYDRYPEKLIDEKKYFYEHVLEKGDWVFYTHDSEYACSRVTKSEKGRFTSLDRKASILRMPL